MNQVNFWRYLHIAINAAVAQAAVQGIFVHCGY